MALVEPVSRRKKPLWARLPRWAALSALALGGCLVSFEDYPVEDSSAPPGGAAGAAGSGAGAAGSGGSVVVDSSTGGTSPGGSSSGGSSTGGSSGGVGAAGTTSGTGGTSVDAGVDVDGAGCGDTLSNPQHCGRCNHDCCGGICVGGKCRPVVVHEGPDGGNEAPQEVAVHGDYLYFWSSRITGVFRVRMPGGPRDEVWNKKQHIAAIAVDATGLYVAGNDDGSLTGLVERVPLGDGGSPQTILDGDDVSGEITLDDTFVYWRSSRSIIYRVQKGTTTLGRVGTFDQGLSTIAVSNEMVFFHTTANTGQIVKVPRLGGNQLPLASAQRSVGGLAANRVYVFWSATDAGSIRRVNVDGSSLQPTDLATIQMAPQAVMADDVYVYWVNYGDPNGTLNAKLVGGGDQIVVASDLGLPRKFLLHEHCVYIATGAPPGRIYRVAKP
jgi:hypothetical protein